jgi:hypothetical protein
VSARYAPITSRSPKRSYKRLIHRDAEKVNEKGCWLIACIPEARYAGS